MKGGSFYSNISANGFVLHGDIANSLADQFSQTLRDFGFDADRLRRFKNDLDIQCININECFTVADTDKDIALEKVKRNSLLDISSDNFINTGPKFRNYLTTLHNSMIFFLVLSLLA